MHIFDRYRRENKSALIALSLFYIYYIADNNMIENMHCSLQYMITGYIDCNRLSECAQMMLLDSFTCFNQNGRDDQW